MGALGPRWVLRLFVRWELMDVETAHDMLAWPHSGFHVHDGVCPVVALAVPDPGRAIGPPHQVPWTAHSPSSTLGGPIEIPSLQGVPSIRE